MSAPAVPFELPPGGRIERLLGGANFQRAFALAASALAIVAVLVMIAALSLADPVPASVVIKATSEKAGTSPLRLSPTSLHVAMAWLEFGMRMLLGFVCAVMALYMTLRGRGMTLARLFACSCAAIAGGVALFSAAGVMAATGASLKGINSQLSLAISMGTILVASGGMAVWMFSSIKFLLHFPKPVHHGVLAPMLSNQDLSSLSFREYIEMEKSQFRAARLAIRSPQFVALLVGLAMIFATCRQADTPAALAFVYMTLYWWCWLPLAVIAAKQKHLDDEGRRTVKWVLLGQSIWLVAFLLILLAVLALRALEVLAFADWADSTMFTQGLVLFLLWGFVLIFILSLAVSILYHGTLDPELILRRTWLVALVTVASGLLFVLLERLVARLVAKWFNVSDGTAFTIVGMLTAVCVFPLRKWGEAWIKRTMERWQAIALLADGERIASTIVFADLSGYTVLTENNEREALILAAIFHRDAGSIAESHNGQLIKTIGDAVLMRFEKPDDAYSATKQLIAEYTAHATPLVRHPLPVHAGIHHGDVVRSASGDVFGATVNLAARLLGAARPHEIIASESVVVALTQPVKPESVGSKTFKNVETPVACFKLATL